MSRLDDLLKFNDFITEARKVFSKIESLEKGQRDILETVRGIDRRLGDVESELRATKREIDAELRVTKTEAAREAGSEARQAVNAVQSSLYDKIINISVEVDRLKRIVDGQQPTSTLLPPK